MNILIKAGEAVGEALVAAAEAKAVEVGTKTVRDVVESLGHNDPNKWQKLDYDPDFYDDFYVNHHPVHPLGHLYPLEPGSDSMDIETPRSGTSTSADSATFINSSEYRSDTMVLPSSGTKRSSSVQIGHNVLTNRTKVSRVSGQLSIAAKTVSSAQTYYDSHLLMPGANEKRLTRLSLKLGKQLYPDVITPFLQNLNGKGVVRMQFTGRCVSVLAGASASGAMRHNHIQMFRHRLSAGNGYNNQTTTVNKYPSVFKNNILYPVSTKDFYPSGVAGPTPPSVGSAIVAGKTAWRDISSNQTYWAPYNLADLEDCSWNLNALKLYPPSWNASAARIMMPDQVVTFLPDCHYRSSFLAYNNQQISQPPGGANRPGTYKYKAVINKGNITYDFMNKGPGGAKVELIVYRVKKSQQIDWDSDESSPMDFVNLSITVPIGQGYLDTCKATAGTENLGGRLPLAADVITNPQFPLLPKLKKTRQMGAPFVEVSRQTFAMPAGSRREMSIDLPGLCYDPVNQPNVGTGNGPGSIGYASVFDEHTYGVFISCSGIVCTDEMTTGATGAKIAYNVGDVISRCDVQFYCTYTEHLSACMYKPDNKPIMYSAGTLTDTSVPTGIAEQPVTILDQGSAVRTPATGPGMAGTAQTTGAGVNLFPTPAAAGN